MARLMLPLRAMPGNAMKNCLKWALTVCLSLTAAASANADVIYNFDGNIFFQVRVTDQAVQSGNVGFAVPGPACGAFFHSVCNPSYDTGGFVSLTGSGVDLTPTSSWGPSSLNLNFSNFDVT